MRTELCLRVVTEKIDDGNASLVRWLGRDECLTQNQEGMINVLPWKRTE